MAATICCKLQSLQRIMALLAFESPILDKCTPPPPPPSQPHTSIPRLGCFCLVIPEYAWNAAMGMEYSRYPSRNRNERSKQTRAHALGNVAKIAQLRKRQSNVFVLFFLVYYLLFCGFAKTTGSCAFASDCRTLCDGAYRLRNVPRQQNVHCM